MARLPQVGGDSGTWGDVLNEFLGQAHADDGNLKSDSVGAAQIKPLSVTNAALANDTIQEAKLDAGVRAKLNAAPAGIPDGSVTEEKLADSAVSSSKLRDGSVSTAKIQNGAVSTEKIAGFGQANGVASLDGLGQIPDIQLPTRLSDAALAATYATATQGAKADAALPASQKGVASGVATLDGTTKVPAGQIPMQAVADSNELSATVHGAIEDHGLDRTRLAAGRRWLFIGDSITNGSTAGNFDWSVSMVANRVAGGLNADAGLVEAATSGYKTSDALTWLPTVFTAVPSGIGGAVILLGTNDSGANLSLATYSANMIEIVRQVRAQYQGVPIVLCTPPPRGNTGANATNRKLIAQYGAWITMWGPANGCEVADVHSALVDPTTGDMAAAYWASPDFTHPTGLGHARMGQAVGKAMLRTYPTTRKAFQFAKTAYSRIGNPLMSGGGASSRPSGWYEQPGGSGTAPTYATVADTTGLLPAGQWMVMDFDATAGGSREVASGVSVTGLSAGDKLKTLGLVLIEDFTGTWEADCAANTAGASYRVANQSNSTIQAFDSRFPGRDLGDIFGNGHKVWGYGPRFGDVVFPTGATGLIFFQGLKLPTGKHVKMYCGGMDVVSLTEMGLDQYASSTLVNLDGPAAT